MALQLKTESEDEALRAKNYANEIRAIERKIDRLSLVHTIGMRKG